MDSYDILSLAPAAIVLILTFVTRDALLSLLIGVLVGIAIDGQHFVTGSTGRVSETPDGAGHIGLLNTAVFTGAVAACFPEFKNASVPVAMRLYRSAA